MQYHYKKIPAATVSVVRDKALDLEPGQRGSVLVLKRDAEGDPSSRVMWELSNGETVITRAKHRDVGLRSLDESTLRQFQLDMIFLDHLRELRKLIPAEAVREYMTRFGVDDLWS